MKKDVNEDSRGLEGRAIDSKGHQIDTRVGRKSGFSMS